MHGIVAAGALAPAGLRELGIERIPLLRVAGETILERTCRCMLSGGDCEMVHILAPEAVALPALATCDRADYSGALIDDFLDCVEHMCQGEAVLLASGDMPLITPEAVAALCRFAQEQAADVVYPAVDKALIEQRFPGSKRTYVKLGPVTVSGGNIFWLKRAWISKRGPLLKQLFMQRKNVLGLARVFGLAFLLRLLCGMVDVPYLERHLSRILHGALRAALLPFPELAADLDKPADLATFAASLDAWR
jgi:GTP:adenosylcobinamide-phosphate guanylyltransferase